MPLSSGVRLGPYEIVSPLGAGGMGEVYRAVDTRLERHAAIKVLPKNFLEQRERIARFEREARAASALNHPNIVTIYETGTSDAGFYIAMELVEGRSLREMLRTGPVPLRRVLALAAQIADGLATAHEAGIVHRDLKPDNLMVSKDGFVKILDFGLAKLSQAGDEREGESRLATLSGATLPGVVLGTAGYMSPEQASGRLIDFRSDQFSLGSILYEMAAGKRAFERETAVQTLAAIVQDEPEQIGEINPKLPANLCWLVERCLAKEPQDRYAATRDLARDLASMRDHLSEVSASGRAPPAPRGLRLTRSPVLAGAVAAVVGLVAFLAGQESQKRRDRDTPQPVRQAITFRRGFLTGARFAPDGQTIVYSAAWDGKPSELFMTRVGSNESRPLGIFPAGILAISSAGEMAISLGCQHRWEPCFGTLARAPLAGGAPREVLDNVGSADWSPDGKELAVVHTVEGRDRLEYPIGKVLFESEGMISSIRISPQGDRIAFFESLGRDAGFGYLGVVDRAGRKRTYAETGGWTFGFPILWNPRGDEIFFDLGRASASEIKGISLSGRIRAASWIPGLNDVSREGRFLSTGAYGNLRSDVHALVPGARKERSLSWLDHSMATDLSHDGSQLLFYEFGSSLDRKQVFTTFLRRTDGSDAKELGDGRSLALSPDSQWALVTRPYPAPHLVLLPTGLGEPRPLPTGMAFVRYHWATFFPDGRRLLVVAEEKGGVRSYIQDVAGGPPKPFAEEGLRATLVSPDGREVAGSTPEGLHLIYRVDGQGRARSIEGALPEDYLVQWSADGKSILVRGAEEQPLTLYRIDLATGRRERWKGLAPPELTGFFEYAAGPKGVQVTPDLRFYAYTFWTDLEKLTLTDLGPDWWK